MRDQGSTDGGRDAAVAPRDGEVHDHAGATDQPTQADRNGSDLPHDAALDHLGPTSDLLAPLDAPPADSQPPADAPIPPDAAAPDAATPDTLQPDAGTGSVSCLWAKTLGGTGAELGAGLVRDTSGNLYITGSFEGVVPFAATALSSKGGVDIFVASYTPSGSPRWALGFGSPNDETVRAITIDDQGNLYVVGMVSGKVDFGTGQQPYGGGGDLFVASFSSTGDTRWAMVAGDNGIQRANAVATDGSNIYVMGTIDQSVDFGGGTIITSLGGYDALLFSLAGDGSFRWAQRYGSGSTTWYDWGDGVGADSTGAVYYLYRMNDTSGGRLGRADSNGIFDYEKLFSGNFTARAMITSGPGGNLFSTGHFSGGVNWQPLSAIAVGDNDASLVSHAPDGTTRWFKAFGGPGPDSGRDLALDSSGNLLLTGYFSDTASFGGASLVSAGAEDVVLASYTESTGAHRFSMRFGGPGNDWGNGVEVDSTNAIYLAGHFEQSMDLAGCQLTSTGASDIFVAKLQVGP